jgi:hypothetical protein
MLVKSIDREVTFEQICFQYFIPEIYKMFLFLKAWMIRNVFHSG